MRVLRQTSEGNAGCGGNGNGVVVIGEDAPNEEVFYRLSTAPSWQRYEIVGYALLWAQMVRVKSESEKLWINITFVSTNDMVTSQQNASGT